MVEEGLLAGSRLALYYVRGIFLVNVHSRFNSWWDVQAERSPLQSHDRMGMSWVFAQSRCGDSNYVDVPRRGVNTGPVAYGLHWGCLSAQPRCRVGGRGNPPDGAETSSDDSSLLGSLSADRSGLRWLANK